MVYRFMLISHRTICVMYWKVALDCLCHVLLNCSWINQCVMCWKVIEQSSCCRLVVLCVDRSLKYWLVRFIVWCLWRVLYFFVICAGQTLWILLWFVISCYKKLHDAFRQTISFLMSWQVMLPGYILCTFLQYFVI